MIASILGPAILSGSTKGTIPPLISRSSALHELEFILGVTFHFGLKRSNESLQLAGRESKGATDVNWAYVPSCH